MKKMWITRSEAETVALGQAIGSWLKGGEVITLSSDLGGGKTTFTRGIAKGLLIEDSVSSPTFTIQHIYDGHPRLIHYDLYRIPELGALAEELRDNCQENDNVVVIEWPEVVLDLLEPYSPIYVRLSRVSHSDEGRKIEVMYHEKFVQLFSHISEVGV